MVSVDALELVEVFVDTLLPLSVVVLDPDDVSVFVPSASLAELPIETRPELQPAIRPRLANALTDESVTIARFIDLRLMIQTERCLEQIHYGHVTPLRLMPYFPLK